MVDGAVMGMGEGNIILCVDMIRYTYDKSGYESLPLVKMCIFTAHLATHDKSLDTHTQ